MEKQEQSHPSRMRGLKLCKGVDFFVATRRIPRGCVD